MIQGKLFTNQLQARRYPQTAIDAVLERLTPLDVPGKSTSRATCATSGASTTSRGRSPAPSRRSCSSSVLWKIGQERLEEIERVDLEAFIEHEQDRGMNISTVRTRLACIIAFLHFLMEQDILSPLTAQENDQAQASRDPPPGHEPEGCEETSLRDR